jgi:hypothetical protein
MGRAVQKSADEWIHGDIGEGLRAGCGRHIWFAVTSGAEAQIVSGRQSQR